MAVRAPGSDLAPRPPPGPSRPGRPPPGLADPPRHPAAAVAPAVLVSLGLFAAFVSIEVTTGGWLATVLEDARGVDDRLAGLSVGAFWGGITIGRLLLGRFDLPDRALLLGVGVLVISFTGLAVVPAPFVLPRPWPWAWPWRRSSRPCSPTRAIVSARRPPVGCRVGS